MINTTNNNHTLERGPMSSRNFDVQSPYKGVLLSTTTATKSRIDVRQAREWHRQEIPSIREL
jgi:hypothetical protein